VVPASSCFDYPSYRDGGEFAAEARRFGTYRLEFSAKHCVNLLIPAVNVG